MLLPSYFEKFVSTIQPSEERISAVADAHNALRNHLQQEAQFSYSIADSFLSGSYGRHTAIDPIKDADIILVTEGLHLSADCRTPSPREVLRELRAAADAFYEDVKLETQRRSVQITLPEDDIRMDVVPAICTASDDSPVFVPDRDQGRWIASHPRGHIKYATQRNQDSGGHFVRVVKAFKWWKSSLPKKIAPKSFLLETIVGHCLVPADTVIETFHQTLANVLRSYAAHRSLGLLPRVADPGLSSNDVVSSCGWTVDAFSAFYDELKGLSAKVDLAIDAAKKDAAIALWRSALGEAYPLALSEEEVAKIAKAVTQQGAPPARRAFPYQVGISARIAPTRQGTAREAYASNGRKLPKGYWLQFRLDRTNVPPPFTIRWAVHNHGTDARARNDLFHETSPGAETQWETLRYRGNHFMDCEVLKDGNAVARARHVVNVG